jgi:hypothetical protein
MTNQEFINSLLSGAQNGYEKYGILPSVTIAQAINESGWGRSSLAKTDNNLFGIKYPGNHDPSLKITKGSWATDDGGYYAHYQSWSDSVQDHGYFLKNNSRYAAAIGASSAEIQVRAIADAGYASDPNYYQTTMSIINSNNLKQYDTGSYNGNPSASFIVESTNYAVVQGSQQLGDILYGRRYRIIVSDNNGNAFDVSQLKCVFSIVKTIQMEPNYSEITIYNLNAQTENEIIMNSARVTVEAGYEGKQFGLIFDGDILQTIRDKEDSTTYRLTIIALDSDRAINFDIANYSILKGQTARTIVDHIINNAQYPISLGNISQALEKSPALTRGKVFFGKSSDYLRQIAQSHDAQYYTENGKVNIIKMTDLPEGEIYDLSPKTGLIGTPEQNQYGVTGQCLINPAIKVNTLIHIDNSLVRAMKIDINGGSNSTIPGSGTTNDVRDRIIAEAAKLCNSPNVGYSEVYRNQTINGKTYYDCSAFTKHCYEVAGLKLDDITNPQWADVQLSRGGKVVSLSEAKAGDLVFWFNGSDCYHVAIYGGNNDIYAASTDNKPFADQVLYEPIYGSYKIGRPKSLIDADSGIVPSSSSYSGSTVNTQAPPFRVLDKDGIYRVIKITYQGDTRGDDWYCNFETITQAGGAIPVVTN